MDTDPLLLEAADAAVGQVDAVVADVTPRRTSLHRSSISGVFGQVRGAIKRNATRRKQRDTADVQKYDSFDFEVPNSLVRQTFLRQRSDADARRESISRWGLTFLVALAIASVAFAIGSITDVIQTAKFAFIQRTLSSGLLFQSLLWYSTLNMALACLAALLVVFIEPVAGGSGIPEIKSILNGIKIPRAFRFRTMMCKAVGVVFSVSSGLPIGREGPLIHVGAICGAGISQGKSTTMGMDSKLSLFRPFRNDREKRDFIACGTAAGVAVAFGAPVGGVLFALEEGSSFWNQALTLRAFVSAMSASFILNVMIVGFSGHPATAATFAFGFFSEFDQNKATYSVQEVPFFIAIGVFGGLFGAAYNQLNRILTIWRMTFVARPALRVLEVACISLLVSLVSIGIPLLAYKHCVPILDPSADESQGLCRDTLVQFTCRDGEYSPIATLFFNMPESAIINLFHSKEEFGFITIIVFMVTYYILSCATYGIAVPSGLFVPNLLVGAAFGRLIGEFLNWVQPFQIVNSGTYALIGSAAVLGGMARMTISLTTILIEATGDIQYGLPIMIVLIVAKWIGDLFNEGLYDQHIHLKGFNFLDWKAPQLSEFLLASDVMSTDLAVVNEVVQVRQVYKMVMNTPHNAYPVVAPNALAHCTHNGTILRRHLIQIMLSKDFNATGSSPYSSGTIPKLNYWDFEGCYPRFPSVESVNLRPSELDMWIDLTPYMNPSPYVIQEHSPVTHAFDLFRTMGLRHLCVVNKTNQIIGIITRKDLNAISMQRQIHDMLQGTWANGTPSVSSPSQNGIRRSFSPYSFVRNLDSHRRADIRNVV